MENLILKTVFLVVGLLMITQDVSAFVGPAMGTSNRTDSQGNFIHREQHDITVRNSESSTVSAGSVMKFETATFADGFNVALATVEGDPVACVVVADITTTSIGKCRVHGFMDGIRFSGFAGADKAATLGKPMYSNANDAATGQAQGYANDQAITGENLLVPFGVFLEASTASDLVKGYINIQ